MAKDRVWLARMTQAIGQHWHKRNVRQKRLAGNGAQNGLGLDLQRFFLLMSDAATISSSH